MLQLLSISSEGHITRLCCTCNLCLLSYVSACKHASQMQAYIYLYICMYAYIDIYMSFICSVFHNTVCAYCVSTCIYIHTSIYEHEYFIYIYMYASYAFTCSCGLAMQKWDAWVSFSLETREFIIFLLLHKLAKLKIKRFIRKKWILQFHTVCVISSSLVNKLYWHVFHWWIITLRTAVTWGCLSKVTLGKKL